MISDKSKIKLTKKQIENLSDLEMKYIGKKTREWLSNLARGEKNAVQII